jgi:hypothetical protein
MGAWHTNVAFLVGSEAALVCRAPLPLITYLRDCPSSYATLRKRGSTLGDGVMVLNKKSAALAVIGCLTLIGCEKAAEPAAPAPTNQVSVQSIQPVQTAAPVAAPAQPQNDIKDTTKAAAPKLSSGLIANGPATYLEGIGTDAVMPKLESVRTDPIANQTGPSKVRLFGLTGGDPAINGLLTYIGFSTDYDSMNFAVGDILDYKILATQPGRIDLEISESEMSTEGDVSTKKRHVVLEWVINDDAETPVNVTIKPAA